jgi:uncharacterized protein (DUF488 family)
VNRIIYTIGHSDLDFDSFVALLKKFKIQTLVDIRSQPYSSYVKHFNKETLKNALEKQKIDYYYGGGAVGGRPDDESLYEDGHVSYKKIRATEKYQKAIKLLYKLISLKNVVLMCSEENPDKCHRSILIAPDLMEMGIEVRNIRSDGTWSKMELPSLQLDFTKQDTDTLPKTE